MDLEFNEMMKTFREDAHNGNIREVICKIRLCFIGLQENVKRFDARLHRILKMITENRQNVRITFPHIQYALAFE